MIRWRVLLPTLLLFIVLSGCSGAGSPPVAAQSCDWWASYAKQFIQQDGRVVEYSQKNRTTSEAQAYALFFALVANDKRKFEAILKWTENNLAKGDLSKNLPSWLWGKNEKGQWGVNDVNPASDADLWLAYTLIQAGRLWHVAKFKSLGEAVLGNVEQYETVKIPAVGSVLLATTKNTLANDLVWRLNLSYTPVQLLRFFSIYKPTGPWASMLDSTEKMVARYSVKGLIPDWIMYERNKERLYLDDSSMMSYDAIRVYLWAGMLDGDEPLRSNIVPHLSGITKYLENGGHIPAEVNLLTRRAARSFPVGFAAAVLPLLKSENFSSAYQEESKWLKSKMKKCLLGITPLYYNNSLAMFSYGWEAGAFSFGLAGELQVPWS